MSNNQNNQTFIDDSPADEISLLECKKKSLKDEKIFTKDEVPSILEIRKNIPSKYFNSSVKKSLQYVVWDLMIVSILFLTYHQLNSFKFIPLIVKNLIILPMYTFAQGTMFWALFVLGHDCGHGSFSRYSLLNDVIGTFLHASILVPYTPWKLSHRNHHKNTGNIDQDEVFHPVRKFQVKQIHNYYKESIILPYFGLSLGWIYYLLQGYGPRAVSHINPFHPLFHKHRLGATISILSVFIILSFLIYLSKSFSIVNYYFLPWTVFASWLVITTFLHHHGVENDLKLPWFSDDQWNYVVGNLTSVDRDYGILHDITHTIGTHQIHHLFPSIPHYYLEEATTFFQQKYPHFVRESKEPIVKTFIDTFYAWRSQYIIDDDTKIFIYQKQKKQE